MNAWKDFETEDKMLVDNKDAEYRVTQTSTGKFMLTTFRNVKDSILVYFKEKIKP